MKRLFFVSVVAAAVLVSFASCGESSETPEEREEAFKNLRESMENRIGRMKLNFLHPSKYSISELKAISAALGDDGDITHGELPLSLINKMKANGEEYVLMQGIF